MERGKEKERSEWKIEPTCSQLTAREASQDFGEENKESRKAPVPGEKERGEERGRDEIARGRKEERRGNSNGHAQPETSI